MKKNENRRGTFTLIQLSNLLRTMTWYEKLSVGSAGKQKVESMKLLCAPKFSVCLVQLIRRADHSICPRTLRTNYCYNTAELWKEKKKRHMYV